MDYKIKFLLFILNTCGENLYNRVNKIKYKCPRCKSEDILEFDNFISCNKCHLAFDKDFLGVINDENILAREELKVFFDAFSKKDN